jgi:hypothetical protein
MVEVLSRQILLDNEGAPFRKGRKIDVIVEEKKNSIRVVHVQFVVRFMR